ncbi:protein-glutamate methylesterase/protein-glutamine glutaminase [Celeribacter sp.]|uniref:protein-glutamate methylesterase/protein-glutamine glutaminase n=1 Tax=Celeribacter sp. TaxID=1890673 RepID=UPI003A9346E1
MSHLPAPPRKARVLIVDDSRTMRGLIRSVLEQDPRVEIVAEASTAREARDAVNAHNPDVMTLDVEMPSMSGIEFLDRLMRHRPMPVVMVSTLTRKGSAVAVEALAKGAVECVEKPRMGESSAPFHDLAEIVVAASTANVATPSYRKPLALPKSSGRAYRRICLIGGSTGAVDAIERVLKRFPSDCPPTLVTQHMPAPFLASFARRLNPLVAPCVQLAEHGQIIERGSVLIAPGGNFHLNVAPGQVPRVILHDGPKVSGHRPSVDAMFLSAVHLGARVVAGLLTGMGRDGAEGMLRLKEAGAITMAQSKDSCVVFGMPRVAGELGGVMHWSSIDDFGDEMLTHAEAAPAARLSQ